MIVRVLFSLSLYLLSCVVAAAPATDFEEPKAEACGESGLWVQLLGTGGNELNDRRGNASYLIRYNNLARVIVDPAPGSALRLDQLHVDINQIDAIAFTQLSVDHAGDLAVLLHGFKQAGRRKILHLLGPESGGSTPSLEDFVRRLLAANGPYPELASLLSPPTVAAGFTLQFHNIPAVGNRKWSRYGASPLVLSSIPVEFGEVPALAWRIETGGKAVVISGDGGSSKSTLERLSEGAQMLIMHHAITENARIEERVTFMTPSDIGRVAKLAGVPAILLTHRTRRTMGREEQTLAAIEKHFQGSIHFGNDLQCWDI